MLTSRRQLEELRKKRREEKPSHFHSFSVLISLETLPEKEKIRYLRGEESLISNFIVLSRHYFVFDGYIGVVMHLMPGSDAVLLQSRKTYYTASPARN